MKLFDVSIGLFAILMVVSSVSSFWVGDKVIDAHPEQVNTLFTKQEVK